MGIFDEAGKATPGGSSRPIAKGRHIFEIQEMLARVSKDPTKKGAVYMIAELGTVESPVHQVGEGRSWLVDVKDSMGAGDAKAFCLALLKCQIPDATDATLTQEEWSKFMEDLVSPAQPVKGLRLLGEGYEKQGKRDPNKTYVIVAWSPVPGQSVNLPLPARLGGQASPAAPAAAPALAPAPAPAPAAPAPAAPANPVLQLVQGHARTWRSQGHSVEAAIGGLVPWATPQGVSAAEVEQAIRQVYA